MTVSENALKKWQKVRGPTPGPPGAPQEFPVEEGCRVIAPRLIPEREFN